MIYHPARADSDARWGDLFEGTGVGGEVYDLDVYYHRLFGQMLIVAGEFYGAGGTPASYVAAWNGDYWHGLGEIIRGPAFCLAVHEEKLFAGGLFQVVGADTVNYIASWDGLEWKSLGTGMNNYVYSLTVFQGDLIAAGRFRTAGGTETRGGIASWDGEEWESLGDGLNGSVFALSVHNGELIASGSFSRSGDIPLNHIGAWDGEGWNPLGEGLDDHAYALASFEGELYAGGKFRHIGDLPVNGIARWNGTVWDSLRSGISGSFDDFDPRVHDFEVFDGKLIVAGSYTHAGGLRCGCITQWDGVAWYPMGSGLLPPEPLMGDEMELHVPLSIPEGVFAVKEYRGHLIAAGGFGSVDGKRAYNIAHWGEGRLDTPPVPPPAIIIGPPMPNPFHDAVTFLYLLEEPAATSLTVYDVLGRRIARVLSDPQNPGPNSLTWDGMNSSGEKVSPGPYFVRLQSGSNGRAGNAGKVVLVR
ncbi:MAG: T9SS type A sorting domain-containing protein [Candidatus Eisenbacteria bacterium]|uniref:T9SS type A sorting domain-containing protein n=1 Tax=Eiseniibacteriota bacterium TaxID=2212470 RepID=A0A948RQW4_UNCEI|nr:T9SS type A sorting domain-containing protein [Candidatus Eisenbacteria bacterium]